MGYRASSSKIASSRFFSSSCFRTACTAAALERQACECRQPRSTLTASCGGSALSLDHARSHTVYVGPQFVAAANPVVRTVLRALFEAMYCLHAPLVARTSGTGSGGIATRLSALRLPPPLQRPAEQQAV